LPTRRSTLSDANSRRSPEPFKTLFFQLLNRCRNVTPKHKFKFKSKFYSLDASTISLCLSLFDWAKFRKAKGGIKLHALLDHDGYLPEWINVTDAKVHESQVPKKKKYDFPKLKPGSILAVDRGYVDFSWFQELTESKITFITRAKKNMKFKVLKRSSKDRSHGILFDHEIELTGFYQKKDYPGKMRLIKYRDSETGKVYVFLTNNFKLSAVTIAAAYKERWQIELFFKWIKQNLKIKSFIGTSENAVLIQIWTAMIYYLLLSYLKYLDKIPKSLLEITRIIREKLLETEIFLELFDTKRRRIDSDNLQLAINL